MMELVTEELVGEHRLFGRRDCDKIFVTVLFSNSTWIFCEKMIR